MTCPDRWVAPAIWPLALWLFACGGAGRPAATSAVPPGHVARDGEVRGNAPNGNAPSGDPQRAAPSASATVPGSPPAPDRLHASPMASASVPGAPASSPESTPAEAEPSAPALSVPAPPAPAPPAPVRVEVGRSLGPVAIGMTREQVRGLGYPVSEADSRSEQVGPFRVRYRNDQVRRVEAEVGALGAFRVDDDVFEVGRSIYEIRDAVGACTWRERGGEYYVCRNGGFVVHTNHSLDPRRYTIAVE